MKFNLKKRPRELHGSEPTGTPLDTIEMYQNQVKKTEEWFEGFEKELRSMLPSLEDCTAHSMHDNVKAKIGLYNQRLVIKEVLGE